jgi:hypothetical protein
MALAALDVAYVMNECRIKLTGASDSGIQQELWGVIKEFLQDSNAWIEHQKLLVTAGIQCYNVVPRDGGQIIRLIGVVDGNRLPVNATMQNLGRLDIHQQINVSSVDIAPTDHTTAANHPWCFAIVKNIAFPATRDGIPIAPEFVLKVYSGAIIDGVLGKMMLQQAKSYTNKELGTYHLKRYRDEIGIARNDTWNQNVQGGQRWRFPNQFATHNQRGGSVQTWPAERF